MLRHTRQDEAQMDVMVEISAIDSDRSLRLGRCVQLYRSVVQGYMLCCWVNQLACAYPAKAEAALVVPCG